MQKEKNIIISKKNTAPKSSLIEFVISALMAVAISGIFGILSGSVMYTIVMMLFAVAVSAVGLVLNKKKIEQGMADVIIIGLCIAAAALSFTAVRVSMIEVFNNIIGYVNKAFVKDYAIYGEHISGAKSNIVLFLIIAALAAVYSGIIIRKRAAVAVALTSVAFIAFSLIIKLPGSTLIMPILVLVMIAGWCYAAEGTAHSVVYMCAGASIVLAAAFLISVITGFGGFESVEYMHNDIKERIYTMRFGQDALPHGDMAKAPEMLNHDKETLTVTMENPQKMYLKGYTGSELDKGVWKEKKEHSMSGEWNGIMKWLESRDYDTNEVYANYAALDDKNTKTTDVTVTNTGADRRYVYMPFNAAQVTGTKSESNQDLQTVSKNFFGAKTYSFKATELKTDAEMLNPSDWVNGSDDKKKSEFLKSENAYRAYVNDTYLDVDNATKEAVEQLFFTNFNASNDEMGVYTITSRIRSILKIRADYEANPIESPTDDFVGWFLNEYRKGNSAYFTTAAVMAYRVAGIPARYAEGYFISDTDVKKLNESGAKTIKLSGKNAHAWVEIYRDGLGWVSVDVTPGFYKETPDMMKTIDISQMIDLEAMGGAGTGEYYPDNSSRYRPKKTTIEKNTNLLREILILVLLILNVALIGIYVRYITMLTKRRRDMSYNHVHAKDAYIFDHIIKAAKADGLNINPDAPYNAQEEFLKRYKSITFGEYERVMKLMQQIRFGESSMRKNEIRTVTAFYDKLRDEVYKGKPFFKKLMFMYIYCI